MTESEAAGSYPRRLNRYFMYSVQTTSVSIFFQSHTFFRRAVGNNQHDAALRSCERGKICLQFIRVIVHGCITASVPLTGLFFPEKPAFTDRTRRSRRLIISNENNYQIILARHAVSFFLLPPNEKFGNKSDWQIFCPWMRKGKRAGLFPPARPFRSPVRQTRLSENDSSIRG